jgi:excisionase family DNA binding protein
MTSTPTSSPAPDAPLPGPRLALSVDEAAALLGVSRDLVYDLVARGEIPSVRLGRRIVVPRHALEQAIGVATTPGGE